MSVNPCSETVRSWLAVGHPEGTDIQINWYWWWKLWTRGKGKPKEFNVSVEPAPCYDSAQFDMIATVFCVFIWLSGVWLNFIFWHSIEQVATGFADFKREYQSYFERYFAPICFHLRSSTCATRHVSKILCSFDSLNVDTLPCRTRCTLPVAVHRIGRQICQLRAHTAQYRAFRPRIIAQAH